MVNASFCKRSKRYALEEGGGLVSQPGIFPVSE